MVMVGDASL